jgi:hypothetical protein
MGITFSTVERRDPSIPGHINPPVSSASHQFDLPPMPSGPPVPMPVTPERDHGTARLRLMSHQLKSFNGRIAEFPKWKSHTECVFNGTGYEKILHDEPYALDHPSQNSLVYSQLSIALCDGDASHIVDNHQDTQNGHQAWQDLLSFYFGSNRSIRSARTIRTKLGRLLLTEGTTASAYINKFQTWHRDLQAINNGSEGYSTDTRLQSFLDNIKHPKYEMAVSCLKNIPELDLETAIERIRQTETDLETERGEKRKMSVLRRNIYLEDGFQPPEEDNPTPHYIPGSPRGKKRRRVASGNTNLPKEIQLRPSGAIAIVEPGIWKGLLPEDHAFVIAWNSRNRHGESTKDIKIPTGVTLIPWSGTGPTDIKKLRRQITEAKSPTAAMKKADKKAISFGLQHEGDGDELEDVDIDLD